MVDFVTMPTVRRTPGRYFEINKVLANRGLTPQVTRVLFIGQRLSNGTKDALDLVQVLDESAARSYFGRGSVLARMLGKAFEANPGLNAWAIALDDHASGVAHVASETIAGSANFDGTLVVKVAGDAVQVSFSESDSDSDLATAIAAAISTSLTPDLPMTAAVNGSTAEQVDFTARNDGTLGGQIDITLDFPDGSGFSSTAAVETAGSTDPDLSTALDLVESEDFQFIVSALNDATNLGSLETHLEDLEHPLVSLGAHGVYGFTGSYSNATTLAANFATSPWMSGGFIPGTQTWAPELGAIYGAVLASVDDPARPYDTLELRGVVPPESVADRLTAAEVEAALNAGVSPFVVGAGSKVRIVRAITTYVENDANEADDLWLDVTTGRVVFWWRRQVNSMLAAKYPRAKNTDARRDAIRQDLLVLAFAAEELEILENVEANAEGFVVQTNGSDNTRVDLITPIDVVNGLHIIAARIDLTQSL